MKLRTYKKKDIQSKRVLLRVDLNISQGVDAGHYRFERAMPQIRKLLEMEAEKIVLLTHIGRPKGKERHLSTQKLVQELAEAIGQDVVFASTIAKAEKSDSRIVLLENTRFFPGEIKNGRRFARQLASLGDVYVNNAFGVCHRKHASIHRITSFIPSFAGDLITEEVKELSRALKKPLILIVGGIKIATKIPLIKKLAGRSRAVLLGSGMVHVHRAMRLQGRSSGMQIRLRDRLAMHKLIKKFENKIILPDDVRVHNREDESDVQIRTFDQIQPDDAIIDIGPQAELSFAKKIEGAKTVIFNGPMGIVEDADGREGTDSIVDMISRSKARVIVGGGDTVDYVLHNTDAKIDFVSTGGGAMLAFLSDSAMPGLEVLQ